MKDFFSVYVITSASGFRKYVES